MRLLDWAEFKSFVDGRGLYINYVETSNSYELDAFDGAFHVTSLVLKSSPANADQTDFEDNYKAAGNKPVVSLVDIKALANPDGMHFRGFGTHNFQPTANSVTDHDYTLTEERYIDGVQYYSMNPTAGDKVTFQIVHPVAGPVEEFATDWLVFEGQSDMKLYRAKIPSGLIIRVKYNNIHASNVPHFMLNAYLHKRI